MIEEQDVRDAFARMVDAGPPAPSAAAALDAGRRVRRRRAALAGGAVLAVLAVIAVGIPRPSPAAPVPPVVTGSPLPVPGLTPARAAEITQRCADVAAAQGGPDHHATLARRFAGIRLYNHTRDDAGEVVLLLGRDQAIFCQFPGRGLPYEAGGVAGEDEPSEAGLNLIPGPITRDLMVGGETAGRQTQLIAGQVVRAAATVTATGPAGTRTVPVVNGTYLIRFTGPDGMDISGQGWDITARDRAGRTVGRLPDGYSASCYTLAGGRRVFPPENRPTDTESCPPAVRWP